MEELISIIIPVYNVEKYLVDCLESVVSQSYANIEIILVNDGSTDNSCSICKRYQQKDKRFRVIDKENEGLSVARDTGIQAATGTYFATIDSDDIIDRYYIEKMYRKIKQYDADICLCARDTIGERSSELFLLDECRDDLLICNREYLEDKYYKTAALYQMSDSWNKLYKKEFVVQSGIRYILNRKYNGTDLYFNYLLLLHNPKIVAVNEALYHYRITENSRVRRKNKPLQEGFEIIIDGLLRESEKLGYSSEMDNQIFAVYVSMIKYVTQDIVEESDDYSECRKRLNNCIKTCRKVTRCEQKKVSRILKEKNMKAFWIIMNSGNGNLVFLYYFIRMIFRGGFKLFLL